MVVHLFASIIILTGCGKDLQTARGVVEEFIDQHYVHINLKKAKDFCVGLALHKINEEIRLTAGQVIDASTRKPKVYYRITSKRTRKSGSSGPASLPNFSQRRASSVIFTVPLAS